MATKQHPSSFNEIHTAFVTTSGGTSIWEILQVLSCISLTPLLVPILIPWIVPPSFVQQSVISQDFSILIRGIVEYPVIIVLPIWIITFFAGGDPVPSSPPASSKILCYSTPVLITLLFIIFGILVVNHSVTAPKWLGWKGHWDKIKGLPTGWSENNNGRLPFITNYRAITIYITILCILAVDFQIFPRRFAKTKDYGISLMDVGTGCFVFANGIVAPEARNKAGGQDLMKSFKSSVPIIILGFVRLISVKGIEYQEVVEEYGVHWNFFFTLAGVKILSSIVFWLFSPSHALKLAAVTSLLYEWGLHHNNFQDQFILNPTVSRKSTLLHANREGIFSLFGYSAIYLASVYFGRVLYFKKEERKSVKDWAEYCLQSLLQLCLVWGCYAVVTCVGGRPCRRTANLAYVLWMIGLNYYLMWGQLFLSFVQIVLQHHGLLYGPILFYELDKQDQDKEIREQMRMERLQAFKKKPKKDEDVDKHLEELEGRLKDAFKAMQKLKGSGEAQAEKKKEIQGRIDQIASEIEALEGNLFEEESDFKPEVNENRRKIEEGSFVLLPDLSKSPVLLEAICFNGLAVFLLGNLLTGLVNLTVYTMYTSHYLSLCYLWCYATVIAGFSVTLYWFQVQLKWW